VNIINLDSDKQIITLQGSHSTYAINIYNRNLPMHLHWGARLSLVTSKLFNPSIERAFLIRARDRDTSFFIEDMKCEYGFAENGDFRIPAFRIRDGRNYPITGPFELDVHLYQGKQEIIGLPSARVQAGEHIQTVDVRMYDRISGLLISMSYTMFPEHDAVTRHVSFLNQGDSPIRIEKAASLSMDMSNLGYELLYLHGAWARERQLLRRELQPGTISFGSTRGTSSHQFSPAFAIVSPETTEFKGEAFGFSLIYSGNFLAELELNQDANIRINLGIHPDTFEWQLGPGQRFDTPEAVMVYADDGLNGMSRRFHNFFKERIIPPQFSGKERPVLFNNWEATYFDFNETVLEELADTAADLGVELFVLDDGWFEGRNSDRSSLGDWSEDPEKLPHGLKSLAEHMENRGLQFGLWVEPEMVSHNSSLAKRHPEWHISNPDRPVAEGRNQLVLDLSRSEVCDFIVETMDGLLSSAPIRYMKWDMNRYLTNVAAIHLPAAQQGEVYHRYVLGLYQVLDEISRRHPEVLFEGCAGGGGRFDPGMLYYMPQYWTSDNTDAISRIRIQYGTSIFFPPITMGAHVSEVPNHQVGRTTSLEIRGHVAMSGNLGYELDLRNLDSDELETIRKQIVFYKKYRTLLQFGRFVRLESPFESTDAAWMFIHPDMDEFIFFWFRLQADANRTAPKIKLAYLDPDTVYLEKERMLEYTGSELMNLGILLTPPMHDYASLRLVFQRRNP